MPRVGRLSVWLVGVLLGIGGITAGGLTVHAEDAGGPPPSIVPAPTVEPPTTVPAARSTTPPAAGVPAATTPVPERAGSGVADVAKGEEEDWTVRRIVTTVALVVVGLAASGFVYGRVRSMSRRSSTALVPSPD